MQRHSYCHACNTRLRGSTTRRKSWEIFFPPREALAAFASLHNAMDSITGIFSIQSNPSNAPCCNLTNPMNSRLSMLQFHHVAIAPCHSSPLDSLNLISTHRITMFSLARPHSDAVTRQAIPEPLHCHSSSSRHSRTHRLANTCGTCRNSTFAHIVTHQEIIAACCGHNPSKTTSGSTTTSGNLQI